MRALQFLLDRPHCQYVVITCIPSYRRSQPAPNLKLPRDLESRKLKRDLRRQRLLDRRSPRLRTMRLTELILDGFKSYPVRTSIAGWDPSFNAVTGL